MAPEQAQGEVEGIDERADVYSLGALLHFLLAGRPPAPGGVSEPLRSLAPAVPRALEAIALRALAAEPAARYPSVEALAADVSKYLTGLAVGAYREGLLERLGRVAGRHRTAILLVLAYLAMRVALLVWGGR
jgi:serine/threonine protein kinase